MQVKLVYSEEALGQLDKLSDFLVNQAGVQVAFDTIDALLDSFDVLEEMPLLGHIHPDPLLACRGYRVLVSGKYVCVYLPSKEEIWIAGVYHTKTDWLISEI